MADKIFVSYRRDDAAADARSVFQHVEARYGARRIFFDVHSIAKGSDFRRALASSLRQTAVMLVVIGPSWLSLTGESGQLRITEEGDYVRFEIALALQSDIVVLPVLVGGARLPTEHELPSELGELAFRQAIELRHTTFAHDLLALDTELATVVGVPLLRRREFVAATAGVGLAGLLGVVAVTLGGVFDPAPLAREDFVTGWVFVGYFNHDRRVFSEGPFVRLDGGDEIVEYLSDGRPRDLKGQTVVVERERSIVIVNYGLLGQSRRLTSPTQIPGGALRDQDYSGLVLPPGTSLVVRDIEVDHGLGNPENAVWIRVANPVQ